MSKWLSQCGFLIMLGCSYAHAESLLRLTCADEDAGAVVSIDGKVIGNCPITSFIPDGKYQVRVSKPLSGGREQFFEKMVTLSDGQVESINVELSAPQLTAEALQAQSRSHAITTLDSARMGNRHAMNAMAILYENGDGVERSLSEAKLWRNKASAVLLEEQESEFSEILKMAEAGSISAMEYVANAYETGTGVSKNSAQANTWRQAAATKIQNDQIKAAAKIKQAELDSASFLSNTELITSGMTSPGEFISGLTFLPVSLISDLIASPTVTTKQAEIRSAAIMRPSSWAKPDSMIAKAARQRDAEGLVAKR